MQNFSSKDLDLLSKEALIEIINNQDLKLSRTKNKLEFFIKTTQKLEEQLAPFLTLNACEIRNSLAIARAMAAEFTLTDQ